MNITLRYSIRISVDLFLQKHADHRIINENIEINKEVELEIECDVIDVESRDEMS